MLTKIFCFLRGYVCVIVKSRFIERFINICIGKNIYLWDIRYKNECEADMKMSMGSFHKIRPVAKKTHSSVRIQAKKGLPIIFHRYKKRYFFMSGFILAICFVFIMSQFIWSIEVVGNENVASEEILQALEELGFKKGRYNKAFDARDLKNNALLKLDKLSWLWVDIKGSKATVTVNEKKQAPQLVPKNTPCDIVALRSGVIKDMTIKEGQSRVQIGQTVMEGELLISGVVQSERIEPRYTHASGEVVARTWYESSVIYPLSREIRTPTGRQKKHHSLCIGDTEIKFFLSSGNVYENYDTIEKKHDLVIFGYYTGLSWKTLVYDEVDVTYEPLSSEQVMENVKGELESKIIPVSGESALLVASDLRYTPYDDENIKVTLTAEYSEPIGYEKTIEMIFDSYTKNTQKE
ncbi:MAG: sporulation protein YqfD [Ruminococcaceae bacterium]|nr:sporulation protein YqfD [Oscillospiraceae bacterium]